MSYLKDNFRNGFEPKYRPTMERAMIPNNQRESVLQYIQSHGEIDFLLAANRLGVSQLTARITELRGEGWRFDKKTKTGKNRYGHSFTKTIYHNARRA